MPTVHFIRPDGQRRTLQLPAGDSLMKAAVSAGVDEIMADCGGLLTCATCHVHVASHWRERLPAMAADEDSMLEMTASPRDERSRLSCQIVLEPSLDGLEIFLPPTQY